MEKTMEIFREDGIEFTSIRTNFGDDGTLSINGQDMGPMVEQFWGDDDYEYFLSIPKKRGYTPSASTPSPHSPNSNTRLV